MLTFPEVYAVPDELSVRVAYVRNVEECIDDQIEIGAITKDARDTMIEFYKQNERRGPWLSCSVCDLPQTVAHLHMAEGAIICSEGCAIAFVIQHNYAVDYKVHNTLRGGE